MDREEYIAYKKARAEEVLPVLKEMTRLEEISAVIKESGDRVKEDSPEIEDIQEQVEKLKKDHPWLK